MSQPVPGAVFNPEAIGDASAAIATLARLHGITRELDPIDQFVDAAARLADAETALDGHERLIVGLQRAGVLSDDQAFALHVVYLRQRAARQPAA